ncbi:MAG TPA: hypothetical protein VHQ94_06615, partial [Pyrinomonadaceae bacterium]|nr:hypothetical protein [Pyrinomonadaceae bacterium]
IWNSAVSQFGQLTYIQDTGRERGRVWEKKTDGYEGGGRSPVIGKEYGRDPRGQARTLDKTALGTSKTIDFKGGKRVN